MHLSTLLSVAVTLAESVSAANIPDAGLGLTKRSAGLLQLDFEVVGNTTERAAKFMGIEKRGDPWFRNLWHTGMYVAYLYVGSNQQPVGLTLDTGLTEIWLPDANTVCKKYRCDYGGYDPSKSSSAEKLDSNFDLTYFDDTYAKGPYYKDTVALGTCKNCAKIKSVQFADATNASTGAAIMGIAPSTAIGSKYPTIMDLMKDQKLIDTKGFSIYLNDQDAKSGSIIFGGYDKAKYTGDLGTLPFWDDGLLSLKLNSVTVNGQSTDSGSRCLLDTGTAGIALDKTTGDAVFEKFKGGHYDDEAGAYLVDCDADSNTEVTFSFNGVDIKMSFKELYNEHIKDKNGNDRGCGFLVAQLDYNLLGNPFLRNTLTVFNFDAKTISLGQVKYTSDSDLVKL